MENDTAARLLNMDTKLKVAAQDTCFPQTKGEKEEPKTVSPDDSKDSETLKKTITTFEETLVELFCHSLVKQYKGAVDLPSVKGLECFPVESLKEEDTCSPFFVPAQTRQAASISEDAAQKGTSTENPM